MGRHFPIRSALRICAMTGSGPALFIASSATMSGRYPPQLEGINGLCDARSIRASTFGHMRMTGKAVLGSAMAFWRNERLVYQRVLVVCSLFHHHNTCWPFQRHVV